MTDLKKDDFTSEQVKGAIEKYLAWVPGEIDKLEQMIKSMKEAIKRYKKEQKIFTEILKGNDGIDR